MYMQFWGVFNLGVLEGRSDITGSVGSQKFLLPMAVLVFGSLMPFEGGRFFSNTSKRGDLISFFHETDLDSERCCVVE